MIVSIYEIMKWDYFTYLKQPNWFLETLKDKLKIDSERIKKQQNYQQQKYGNR